MYRKILDKLIYETPDLPTLRIFHKMTTINPYENNIAVTKQFIANELNIHVSAAFKSFKWLIENNYIAETSVNGIKMYRILTDNKPIDGNKTIDKLPRQKVVSKGGKTVTRMMVEGF